jgi:hypothetical protein
MSNDTHHSTSRVNLPAELDCLVGIHVTGEVPEVVWADSHGHFEFASEAEARDAVNDPYFQQFLPDVDWSQTVIQRMDLYRPYCSDPAVLWRVVEKATEKHGALSVLRKQGHWWAAFGKAEKKGARTAPVAICLAALEAAGIAVEIDHDRVDAELSRPHAPEEREDLSVERGLN